MTSVGSGNKRVLLVSNTAFSLYNFRQGVMQALLDAGFEVFAAAPRDSYAEKLERMGVHFLELRMDARGVNPWCEVGLFFRLLRMLRQIRPITVFNYTIKPVVYGSFAARLVGVPSVAVVTGLGYAFLHRNWITRMARVLLRAAFRFTREVWVINPDDGQLLREYQMVRPGQLRQLFGEGVNLDYFRPAPWHDGDEVRFLLVARMLRDKGVMEFAEAARQLKPRYPHVRFSLLGPVGVENPTAIPRETINAWVAQGWLEYLGVTEDVRPYIAASDCVVLPSYREGVPRSLMEASAMSRPIVTTDSPGCREVVADGETGYLCRVKDAQDLANKLELLLNLPRNVRMAMGRCGSELMKLTFDEQRIIAIYLTFLADL